MKKIAFVLAASLALVLFAHDPILAGAEKTGPNIIPEHTVFTVLTLAQKSEAVVVIYVENGIHYEASKIKNVASEAVVLEGPAGKDSFDVYIPLNRIVTVEVRVRP